MLKLSFDELPHYLFSDNRQFLPGERHIDRLCGEDVLLLVRKGVLRFHEDGVLVELHAGEYYIQRAGLYQQGLLPSDAPNYFFVHFHGVFKENGRLPLRGSFNNESARPILQALKLLGIESPKLEYEKNFYALLSLLSKQQHDETTAENIRSYLLTNFEKQITLDDVRKEVFLSKNQIINVFRAAYGKTPHRYLLDYRLDKACEFLLSTARPVAVIAYAVGFEEYSVFYRAFVAKYGISPADYRHIRSRAIRPDGKIDEDVQKGMPFRRQ